MSWGNFGSSLLHSKATNLFGRFCRGKACRCMDRNLAQILKDGRQELASSYNGNGPKRGSLILKEIWASRREPNLISCPLNLSFSVIFSACILFLCEVAVTDEPSPSCPVVWFPQSHFVLRLPSPRRSIPFSWSAPLPSSVHFEFHCLPSSVCLFSPWNVPVPSRSSSSQW